LKEIHFQAFWERQTHRKKSFKTLCGKEIILIHPGIPNAGSGPDFECGIIKIDNILLAGNIELHINRDDFFKHKHQTNQAYSNLLLHVFLEKGSKQEQIPGVAFELCLEDNEIESSKSANSGSILKKLYCFEEIHQIEHWKIDQVKKMMLKKRLELRHEHVHKILIYCRRDWQLAYLMMSARAMGAETNSEEFEQLLRRHSAKEIFVKRTRTEELQKLFSTQLLQRNESIHSYPITTFTYSTNFKAGSPASLILLRTGRIRPAVKPTKMLRSFLHLLPLFTDGFHVYTEKQNGIEAIDFLHKKIAEILKTCNIQSKQSNSTMKTLAARLMVNSIVPMIYSYGLEMNNARYLTWAKNQLALMESENNFITRIFSNAGVFCENASESQAILNLYKTLCLNGNCENCPIKHHEKIVNLSL
jgi:hypothetical protein